MQDFVKGFCYGVLTLKPSELDEYSLYDIWLAYVGHLNDRHLNNRTGWEQTRYLAFHVLKPYSKTIEKPSDLGRFAWEFNDAKKGSFGNPWTKSELEEMKKRNPKWFK